MEEKIVIVLNEMSEYLSITQMKKLQEVIIKTFAENEASKVNIKNEDFLNMFLAAKRIEGCSERTINYYRVTVQHLLSCTEKNVRKISTEEMREYLSNYQKRNNCSNVTIDNVRRNISSFFSWLEEEDYILKSPMKRIHKIKTKKIVKNTISDEEIEKLRDNCKEKRDLAMIDLLYSTGIRVGELVNLNIDDINFEGRECVVYGKGDKERRVYFDAKTKVHLKQYLENRIDNNEALFVTLDAPYERLKISGVEIRLRNIGKVQESDLYDCDLFEKMLIGRDDYFDFTISSDYDITTVPNRSIIKMDGYIEIPEDFDMMKVIDAFKPFILNMNQFQDMEEASRMALQTFLGSANAAKIPLVFEGEDTLFCSKIFQENMTISYEELSEIDENITILARVTSQFVSSTKPYYDPLKDFMALNRMMRKSMGDRGKEFSPIYVDDQYRMVEVLAIYR